MIVGGMIKFYYFTLSPDFVGSSPTGGAYYITSFVLSIQSLSLWQYRYGIAGENVARQEP